MFVVNVLETATVDAPEKNYDGIGFTRVRLEDNPNCNIGIHFDLIADKIGKLDSVLDRAVRGEFSENSALMYSCS